MATIRARQKADGSLSYTAQIRIKKNGAQVYQESQTFARRKAAEAWAKRRESELAAPGAIERETRVGVTLREMIERYLAEHDKTRPFGKTKETTLRRLAAGHLGELRDDQITSQTLVDFAQWRMSEEGGCAQPQTVGNDLSHLGAVLSIARPAWGYEVDANAMADARRVLKRLGHKMRSSERDRRPSLDELGRLLQQFAAVLAFRPTSMAMPKVMLFALFSTRRQEEIVRIRWADLDEARQRVLVRDMKNPGDKWGNDVWCHLPDEAMAIVRSMPRTFEEIFPYTVDAIQGAWTRACAACDIADLRFHDLRHEGVSRLFEMGWDIPKVASVSGHRNWNAMRRYTHLHGHGDKYAGWEWLPQVLAMPVTYGAWVERNKRPSGAPAV
jgi:integrase